MQKDLRAALYHLQEALDHEVDRERNVLRAQRKLADALWQTADEHGLTLELRGSLVKPVSRRYEVTSYITMADMIECILDDETTVEHSRVPMKVSCPDCSRVAQIEALFELRDERLER
tara:strand:- start:126 stop:479 length:354 start_codon:yes stop_codon:yes gene_type:complete